MVLNSVFVCNEREKKKVSTILKIIRLRNVEEVEGRQVGDLPRTPRRVRFLLSAKRQNQGRCGIITSSLVLLMINLIFVRLLHRRRTS